MTPEQQTLFNQHFQQGYSHPSDFPQILENYRRELEMTGDPNEALKRAFDDSLRRQISRETFGIGEALADPGIGVEAAKQHFEQHGIVGGTGEIAKSIVTWPFVGTYNLMRGDWQEQPLQTMLAPLSFIGAARGMTALGGIGARVARLPGAAAALGRASVNPTWRALSATGEVGDVVTGAREWPLELGAEGVAHVGTTGLGRIAQGQPLIPLPKARKERSPTAPGTPTQAGPTDPYYEIQPTQEQVNQFWAQASEEYDFDVPPPIPEPSRPYPGVPFSPANIDTNVPFAPNLGQVIIPEGVNYPDPEQVRLDQALSVYNQSVPPEHRVNQFRELNPEVQQWLAQRYGIMPPTPPTDTPFTPGVTPGDVVSRADPRSVSFPAPTPPAPTVITPGDIVRRRQPTPTQEVTNEVAAVPQDQPTQAAPPPTQTPTDPQAPPPQTQVDPATGGEVGGQSPAQPSVGQDGGQAGEPADTQEVDGPYEPISTPASQRTILSNVNREGYQAEYVVMELGDLIMSMLPTRQENPAFPQHLQPRNRDRAALWQLASSRSKNIEPNWYLADVPYLQDGTPIIGDDMVVESGNGRVLSLTLASIQSSKQWRKYENQLRRDIEKYGLTAQDLEGKNNPVLVRRRLSQVNRRAFVREANDPNQVGFSSAEQAAMSAENLSDALMHQFTLTSGINLRAMLLTDTNKPFITAFLAKFSPEERAKLVDAKGMINADGIARIEQGMLARTFGGEAGQMMVSQFIEQTSDTMKRLETAIRESLPFLASAEHLVKVGMRPAELSIAEDIAKAVVILNDLQRSNTPVIDYMNQTDFAAQDLSETTEKLIPFLDQHRRGAKRFRSFMKAYAGMVMDAREADTSTAGLFGDELPTVEYDKDSMVDTALEENIELQGYLLDVASGVRRMVGNQNVDFVPVGLTSQLSDVASDLSQAFGNKQVTIAGVQHSLQAGQVGQGGAQHISNATGLQSSSKAIYERTLEEGVLQPHESTEGDWEGKLVFFTLTPMQGYRFDDSYGFVLDTEKMMNDGLLGVRTMLSYPDVLYGARMEAALNKPDVYQGGGTETELVSSQPVDINKYLLGVIENGQVYVKRNQLADIASDRQTALRQSNPTLTKKIDQIINEEPVKGMRRVIRGIYQNVLSGKPVNLTGKQVRSATELAVLTQSLRNALVEDTRIVYLDENLQIIRQEGWSLNRSNRTTAGDFRLIDEHMQRLGASYFIRLHNHPSARAALSDADNTAAAGWRQYFGENFMGDVVINSGTYAYAVWNKSGEFAAENDVQLPAEMVGWDTTAEPDATGVRPGDPLYEGAAPPATEQSNTPQSVANLGALLKTPKNWVTLVMVGLNGRIGAVLEYQGIENLNPQQVDQWIRSEGEMWGGHTVHVLASEGDWYNSFNQAKEKFSALEFESNTTISGSRTNYRRGIGSVWIDGKPLHPIRANERDYGQLGVTTPATLHSLEAYEIGNESAPNPIPNFIDEAYNQAGLSMELSDYIRQPGVAGSYTGTGASGSASSIGNKVRTQVSKVDERIGQNLGILDKLDGWTAKARQTGRWLASEVRSGYRVAEKLEDAGQELMGVIQERRDFVRRNQARDQQRQKDVMDRRNAYVKNLHDQHRAQGGQENIDVFYAYVDELLWRYAEEPDNVNLPSDLQQLAGDFKETRRLINKERAGLMMAMRDEVESIGETLSIWDSENNTERWHPIMPGWMWDEQSQRLIRVEQNPNNPDAQMLKYYTVEEAIDISDRLYLPHDYTRGHWDNVYQQSVSFINMLGGLAESPQQNLDSIQPDIRLPESLFTYDSESGAWTNTRGESFDDPRAAAKAEITYQIARRDKAQYYLRQMEAMAEGRLGRHGHLERKRETEEDDNYQRDLGLLMSLDDAFWERAGDIRYYGQFDPVFQSHPRLKVYLERVRDYAANPKEEALRAFTAPLIYENVVSGNERYAGISTEIALNRKAQYLMQNWDDIDVNELISTTNQRNEFRPITPEMLATLNREGLIVQDGQGGWKIRSKTAQWRILAEHLQTTREREGAMYSIVSGLSKWDRLPTEETSERAWQRVSDLTTMLTLGFRASAQNIFEIPLLMSLTGSKAFVRAARDFASDPDVRELGPRIGAVMRQSLDYLAHGQLQERWLGFSQFSRSDQFSRSFGAYAGWEAVKDAIREYLANPGRSERVRLEQLQVNPAVIEGFRRDGEGFDIEHIFTEAWDRVRDNVIMASGVRPTDAPNVSNPFVDTISDEMAKSAAWISNVVFKEYDAASLPKFLRQQNAMIRVFLKYKAWQGQQHAFVMRTIRHAIAEAKQGNWKPAGQFAQSAAALGLGGTIFTTFFALLSGRVEPGEMWSWARAMDGITSSASLGVFSMLMEAAMLADGSPYRGMQILESTLSSPTVGVVGKIGGPAVALDIPGTASAIVQQAPLTREVIRYGTGPYEWLGGGDETEARTRSLGRLARENTGR